MSSSSSASSRHRRRYDVFLSFRGKDTRNNFVGHLHAKLTDNCIETFIDSEELRRGEYIAPALLNAIEESRIAVVVFSKKYADSWWCLDELVHIMNCSEAKGLIVLPVFFDVHPSDVRNQTGDFGKGFSQHTNAGQVNLWRNSLEKVGGIAGWDLNNPADSHEARCIINIMEKILSELGHMSISIDENLIGVERRMPKVISRNLGSNDVVMIGILGMGGSGKTTIASAVFNDMYQQFDGASFVGNIRKVSKINGLVFLQKQVLSFLPHTNLQIYNVYEGRQKIRHWLGRKRVLIVLDDVDKVEQLEALAGARDWFGYGSRIIITTRDERVLVAHKLINKIYNVSLLNDEEAIQLVNKIAFNDSSPTEASPREAHKESLNRIIRYAGGLPYALKCLGSKLCGRPVDQWASTLDGLTKCPETETNNMLKWSFDGLNPVDQEIFLDIACFFNGWIKDEVINILDSCGLFADSGLGTLKEKSLITFSKECVHMHNLIQEMGRNFVRQENAEPARQSRLWHPDEIKDVLMENKGTEAIKAMVMSNLHKLDARNATDIFTNMKKLRLLHVNTQKMTFQGLGFLQNACQWILPGSCSLKYLPCDLRWLTWDFFNLELWPEDFKGKNLVGLQMRHSSIVDLSRGRDMKFLGKLKFLDLGFSRNLVRTPDFGCLPDLEKLNLEFCSSLVEVHPSIGVHKSLTYVNLRFCKKLESFPSTIKMRSLQILDLSGCSKLKKIPEFSRDMDSLSELSLSHTVIEELPSSIGDLPTLALLELINCRNLTCIPISICTLDSLEILLYGCSLEVV